ncbi:hypothetical protein BCR42DRAFT_342215 [Absidia repens]|uniref:Threonine/serine exporter-like N-terminal domain-containing protein n=1 Tax=Absidia repens TaxID=90262 RepID=A0A1X2IXS7_9FUNG|nr:hypothetical protein BCR42DRAFT_342215 [Absidia repens]
MAAPPTCGPWTLVVSFTFCAFSACIIMFKGSWINSGFAALFGLVIGGLMVMSSHMPVYARVFEISTCACLAFAVRSLHEYCCFKATVLPPIVILLPGFAMTMAVMEITSKHIVVGTIRLVYAVLYSFLLAYGLELGSYLYDVFHPDSSPDGYCPGTSDPTASVLPPKWTFIPLFPILTCGISMAFGSSPRQWISAALCGALGFSATFFLSPIITDSDILNAISAFLVGLYAHLALKMTGEPPISPLSVGLTLLVPGSIGVEGAYTLLHQQDLIKFNFALKMLNIAMGLSVGLFASGMVVYPFGKRRSLYISL